MMMDGKGALIIAAILAVIGFVVGFVLYSFGVISFWVIFGFAIGTPITAIGIIFVLLVLSWMASGSH